MTSHVTRAFRRHFDSLPTDVQKQAVRAYRRWRHDPHHSSLQFKLLTLPRLKRVGFLALRGLLSVAESDILSPSVRTIASPSSGMPYRTQTFLSLAGPRIPGRIFIPVSSLARQGPTLRTAMRAVAECLLYTLAAVTTVLTCPLRCYSDGSFTKHLAVVFKPDTKLIPARIVNAPSQAPAFNHVRNPQVLIRHEVVRHHYITRLFDGVCFTLARHFQVLSGKTVVGFLAVVATFLFTTATASKEFQAFLGLTKETRILGFLTLRVGIERLQANIKPDSLAGRLSFFRAVNADSELDIYSSRAQIKLSRVSARM